MKRTRKKLSLLLVLVLVIATGICGLLPAFATGDSETSSEKEISVAEEQQEQNEENNFGGGNESLANTKEITPEPQDEAKSTESKSLPESIVKSNEKSVNSEVKSVTPDYESATSIYLDGKNGKDENDGLTKEKAVKTFEQAQKLTKEHTNITNIVVVGTTKISGDITLDGTKAKVIRGEDFKGYLFEVTDRKTATLKDIVIDGNGEKVKANNSLIYVNDGTLNITSGTLLENNNMIKGRFQDETTGGAVYAYGGTINMNSGIVKNNRAGFGGGICISADVVFNLGGDAQFIGNKAYECGGAISVGANYLVDGNITLNMDGGIIKNNTAGATGGGIHIAAAIKNYTSKAIISAGRIENNKLDNTGQHNMAFGGGGIYVNGIRDGYTLNDIPFHNGELYITNAIIRDNFAKHYGGGLAGCPVSKTYIYENQGAAIFNNKSVTTKSNDMYIESNSTYNEPHNGQPTLYLASRMLGGMPYNWVDDTDKKIDVNDWQGIVPDFEKLKATAGNKLNVKQEQALGKVFIIGNESQSGGGGIGSNGTVIIGEPGPNKDVQIEKTWDESSKPEEVTVEAHFNFGKLIKDIEDELKAKRESDEGKIDHSYDYSLGTIVLNDNNEYKGMFKNLPATVLGKNTEDYIYFREDKSDRYNVTISKLKKNDVENRLTFSLQRPWLSDYENVANVYYNYYGYLYFNDEEHKGIENEVFDSKTFGLKDFKVIFRVYNVDEKDKPIATDYMENKNVEGAGTTWQKDTVIFKNIPLPENVTKYKIEKYNQYDKYTGKNEPFNYFEPWLLEYNIFLQIEGDTVVIKVPQIRRFDPYESTPNDDILRTNAKQYNKYGDPKIDQTNKNYSVNIKNTKIPPILVDPPVEKNIIGGKPDAKQKFQFKMVAKNKENPMPEGSKNGEKIITKIGAGKVEFGDFYYTKAGTYEYVISEIPQKNKEYTYDKTVYTIKDVVTVNDEGKFNVERTITNASGEKFETATFTNRYKAPEQPEKPGQPTKPEKPNKPGKPGVKTGDESGVIPVVILMGLAVATVFAIKKRTEL